MSKAKKLLLTKIILGTLTALAFVLIGLTIFLSGKINQLNKQNKALKELNESYEGFLDELGVDNYEHFVFLTYIDLDGNETIYFVDKRLELSIYEFLLTKDFSVDDFASYDGTNYYFKDTMTDVLGLDESYYDDYGWLEVGLQAIVIDDDYTVIRSKYPDLS